MATSNARIQFSTADEKTWKDINPVLREGELVITKKPSGKYRLYVGGTGGSKFNDSILVWDEEEAENLANKAASNANLAEDHATSAGMSANAAMSSKSAAAASASYAAQSKEAAKASADTAKQSMETAKTNAINAAQSSAFAAESESKANVSKNAAEKSASAAKTSETNARSSEQAAAASAATVSYATQEEVNAGIENKKIVSPATLAPLVHIIQRKTAYKVGECLYIPGRNDVYLECITAGTTAATAPDDLLTISGGVTINDGTAMWEVKTVVNKEYVDSKKAEAVVQAKNYSDAKQSIEFIQITKDTNTIHDCWGVKVGHVVFLYFSIKSITPAIEYPILGGLPAAATDFITILAPINTMGTIRLRMTAGSTELKSHFSAAYASTSGHEAQFSLVYITSE